MTQSNIVRITGTLSRDPIVRTAKNNSAMTCFQVCVRRREPSKATDYLDVVAWDTIALQVQNEFHAGSRIHVSGYLKKSNFIGLDGKKHIVVQIVADEVSHPEGADENSDDDAFAEESCESGDPCMA